MVDRFIWKKGEAPRREIIPDEPKETKEPEQAPDLTPEQEERRFQGFVMLRHRLKKLATSSEIKSAIKIIRAMLRKKSPK